MLLRSPVRVGAPEELGSVLLRSTPGSQLLSSQGRCSSGAGARGGSCQERPSPTTPDFGMPRAWCIALWPLYASRNLRRAVVVDEGLPAIR